MGKVPIKVNKVVQSPEESYISVVMDLFCFCRVDLTSIIQQKNRKL